MKTVAKQIHIIAWEDEINWASLKKLEQLGYVIARVTVLKRGALKQVERDLR